jgi:hypothetical protein
MRVLKTLALVTLLLSNAVLLLALLSLRKIGSNAAVGQAEPRPVRNGDVNCDGKLDITDPIATLRWLFNDGEEPCAFAANEPSDLDIVLDRIEDLRAELIERLPPSGDEIVVLTGMGDECPQGTDVYTVPDDKEFWLTTFQAVKGFGGEFTLREIGERRVTRWPATRELLTVPHGIPFAPGSRVNALIEDSTANNSNCDETRRPWALTGYLRTPRGRN